MIAMRLFDFVPTLAEVSNPLEHVVDHPIWQWQGWWLLTNHMVMMILAALLMLAIFIPITRRYQSGEHIPPNPFFSQALAESEARWPEAIAAAVREAIREAAR